MLAPQWSATAAYNFLDVGSDHLASSLGVVTDAHVHAFKVGASEHFAPASLFGHW